MTTVLKRMELPSKAGFREIFEKLNSRWAKGKPVARITNELRMYSCLQIFDGLVFEDMPSPSEMIQSKTHPVALRHQSAYSERGAADNEILHAVFSYMTNTALLQSDTPNYFRLSEGLMSALMSTELRGVYPEDIATPFPGFFLEIPKGYFYWHHPSTGHHPVELIGIAEIHKGREVLRAPFDAGGNPKEGWAVGYRLMVVIYGGPNENSTHPADDGCGFFSIPLHTPNQTISEMWEEDESLGEDSWADKQRGKIGTRDVDGKALRCAIRHLCLNFLLYIASCPEDIRHVNAEAVAKIHKARKTKGKNYGKKRLGALESDRTFLVGSTVYVDKDQADYGREGGASNEPRHVQFRSVVRGHWKRQPYGPMRSKRKLIWVKPHSRGGDAEKVFGHNYVVR